MCGRFTLRTPASQLVEIFGLAGAPELKPRFNIVPTQPVAAVCVERRQHSCMLTFSSNVTVTSTSNHTDGGNRTMNQQLRSKHSTTLSLLFLFTFTLTLAAPNRSLADGWKAGAAKVNITPKNLMWMSGYASRSKPAEGKMTDLWAKALVLEDSAGQRAVLVSLDLIGLGRDTMLDIQSRLHGKYQLEARQVALCCSHTHTGPVVGRNLGAMYFIDDEQWKLIDEYEARLKQDIVAVVGDALKKLAPAELARGNGRATFAVNRRENPAAKVPELREKGQLKGPFDHDVPVLKVTKGDKLTTLVFGYACHSTTLSLMEWSGDYPGFAQIEVEKAHPGTLAMFWAGCGADQNPLPRRTVELAKQYGSQLAKAVDEALNAKMQPITAKLGTAYDEIDLAFDELPTREQIEKDTKSSNRYVASRARLLLKQIERDGKLSQTYPYPVQTWRLGRNVVFVTLGGEVVVDFALRLKRELGQGTTWVAGYTNDVVAYIPSLRVLKEGGYEGATAMIYYGQPTVWAPQVEEHVVKTVRKQAKRLGAPIE